MLVIHDEQLSRQLQRIAERENRPVEDVLKSLLDQYPAASPKTDAPDQDDPVKRVRRKAYAKARQYWQSAGDVNKANLSDEELDEQFGAFDKEGIPRLKAELESPDPPAGSLAFAAKIAEEGQLRSGKPDLARRSEEILDQHFAEDFAKRVRGEDTP